MKNLTTGIFAKCGIATDLYTDIGGRLYKIEAPQNATLPYVVYFVYSNIPEYVGGSKTIEKYWIQFSLFSSASGTTEIENMLTHLRALYDDCVLTITGSTPIYFIRGNFNHFRDEITTPTGTAGIWHFVQEYDGWAVRN